jgi:hypothetical protein
MANEKKKMNVTVTAISTEDLRKMLAGAGKGGAYHYVRDEILRKINASPGSENHFPSKRTWAASCWRKNSERRRPFHEPFFQSGGHGIRDQIRGLLAEIRGGAKASFSGEDETEKRTIDARVKSS